MEERRSAGNEEEQSYFNEETPCPRALTALTNAPLTSVRTMNKNYGTKDVSHVKHCLLNCWFPPDVLNCLFGILNTSSIVVDPSLNLKAGGNVLTELY